MSVIKKQLKCNKGITLVELIISMMLFAIITVAVCAVFLPVLRAYEAANSLAECNTLIDNLANQIIGDLSEATAPLENLGVDNELSITITPRENIKYTRGADGVLLKNQTPVFSKDFYKNKNIGFSCRLATGVSGTAYILSLFVTDKNGGIISRDYAVKPLVLNQSSA